MDRPTSASIYLFGDEVHEVAATDPNNSYLETFSPCYNISSLVIDSYYVQEFHGVIKPDLLKALSNTLSDGRLKVHSGQIANVFLKGIVLLYSIPSDVDSGDTLLSPAQLDVDSCAVPLQPSPPDASEVAAIDTSRYLAYSKRVQGVERRGWMHFQISANNQLNKNTFLSKSYGYAWEDNCIISV